MAPGTLVRSLANEYELGYTGITACQGDADLESLVEQTGKRLCAVVTDRYGRRSGAAASREYVHRLRREVCTADEDDHLVSARSRLLGSRCRGHIALPFR
jgi:hypothetical protein